MRALLICFLFFICFLPAEGQDKKIKYDSSAFEIRTYDAETLKDYQSQEAFQYETPTGAIEPWFVRLWRRLTHLFPDLSGLGLLVKIVFYVFLLFILVLLILSLLGVSVRSVFYKKPGAMNIPYHEDEIDIHQVDFNELVARALAEKNYREAVRYRYLQVLKALNDHGIIQWQKDKINRQYIREINSVEIKKLFTDISRHYEYVWYGNFSYGESQYEKLNQMYLELMEKVNEKRVA